MTRKNAPPDLGQQMMSRGPLPKDLQLMIDNTESHRRRSEEGYAYVSAQIIGEAVHDLTTSIVHKAKVVAGADDECLVVGRAIVSRLRVDR